MRSFYIILCLTAVAVAVAEEANGGDNKSNIFFRGQEFSSSLLQDTLLDTIECNGITSISTFPFATGGSTLLSSTATLLDTPMFTFATSSSASDYHGSNYDSSSDDDCTMIGANNGNGVWYSIRGNDTFLHAKLFIDTDYTNQRIAVFEGPNHIKCGEQQQQQQEHELKCISSNHYHQHQHHNDNHDTDGHNNNSSSSNRELMWFASKEKTYFFKVFGVSDDESGLFVLNMDEMIFPRPKNDHCENAERILMPGQTVTGSSTGAWPHKLNIDKCMLKETSRGLFYSIQGTGKTISLSLRTDITTITSSEEEEGGGRLEIAILANDDCSYCIGNSQFITTKDSKHIIQFESNADDVYTIVISGQGTGDSGVFQLTWEVRRRENHQQQQKRKQQELIFF